MTLQPASFQSPRLSPVRLVALALVAALVFAALLVPLHRVMHLPVKGGLALRALDRDARLVPAHAAHRGIVQMPGHLVAPPGTQAISAWNAGDTDRGPFDHHTVSDCDSWNAVFGADASQGQPAGMLGGDVLAGQRPEFLRDVAFARIVAGSHLARGPPRC